MTTIQALNLNLATRPLRNRRLYKTAVWALAGLMALCAGLSVFVFLKYGGQDRRVKAASAEAQRLQGEAQREVRRLDADIKRAEAQSKLRVDLVNAVILKKSFRWTALFAEIEKALPGPSYITALRPEFTADGSVAMHIRVNSRSLNDLSDFITALTAGGFKGIKVGGTQRSEDGRIIAEIDLKYERAL
jgi:Tfp pilus assembly protein PilN